ncbi:MAG: hypothetical protein JWM78_364 [Verrucomicrobiaceae bacterium]|nr:hypothetical protein [Verrucomicrobiaceae bacterium]
MTGNRYIVRNLHLLRQRQRGTFKRTRISDGWEVFDSFDAIDIPMIDDLPIAEFEYEAKRCIVEWNAVAPATWLYEFVSLA